MNTLRVRKIGTSLGIALPKSISDQMQIKAGDTLHAAVEAGGVLRVSVYDPKSDATAKALERTRRKYRNALRALAR
jgi:putative addiction module antidote